MTKKLNQQSDFLYFDEEEKIIKLQNDRIRLSKLIHKHQYIDRFRSQILSEINRIETNFRELCLYLKK